MATRLDADGRRLLEELLRAATAHRARCAQSGYRGDREACAAVAEQVEAFVAGGGQRMLLKSEDGDDDAHRRLMDTGWRILATVGGAYEQIARGSEVGDLVDAIKRDAKTTLTIGAAGFGILAVAAAALYLALAPSPFGQIAVDRYRERRARAA